MKFNVFLSNTNKYIVLRNFSLTKTVCLHKIILFQQIITFGLVGFYGISTIVGYLMPNSLYTYILNISDLVGLGFMAHQPL